MEEIGPVQVISIGFDRDANFEGKVIEELAKLESERTIRVLDVLFIARDTDSEETVVLEHPEAAEARDLRRVFRGAGGRIIGEGFLTPETIRAVEPELAALSEAIAKTERHGAPS